MPQQNGSAVTLPTIDPELEVRSRYSQAATATEASLCCAVNYDLQYLQAIPQEVIDRDYGCGDPSPFVRAGDTVLDLGSGGGKLCFIAAQVVGPTGNVIGVDCNAEMLALARKHQPDVAERIGYDNVDFRCGRIQDLQLDLERISERWSARAISSPQDLLQLRAVEEELRRDAPLVASDSVDCVVSNCVLNLVTPRDRQQLFAELFRVLKKGGRAAISDIVCDADVPEELKNDPVLWSGCISGAWREDEFLKQFEQAGFYGAQIVARQTEPWRTVAGIEFRSMTVLARKGKQGPCWERNQAVVYRGPFRQVNDDDGHAFVRGERTAVCDKTFQLLQREPYADQFFPVPPLSEIPLEDAQPFDCTRRRLRDPRETKGATYDATTAADSQCIDGCC